MDGTNPWLNNGGLSSLRALIKAVGADSVSCPAIREGKELCKGYQQTGSCPFSNPSSCRFHHPPILWSSSVDNTSTSLVAFFGQFLDLVEKFIELVPGSSRSNTIDVLEGIVNGVESFLQSEITTPLSNSTINHLSSLYPLSYHLYCDLLPRITSIVKAHVLPHTPPLESLLQQLANANLVWRARENELVSVLGTTTTTASSPLKEGSKFSTLTSSMLLYNESQNKKIDEAEEVRISILRELQEVFDIMWSLDFAPTLTRFGSSVNGLGSDASDIDVILSTHTPLPNPYDHSSESIVLASLPFLRESAFPPVTSVMKKVLSEAFLSSPFTCPHAEQFKIVNLVSHARVPVLKLSHIPTGVEVDVCVCHSSTRSLHCIMTEDAPPIKEFTHSHLALLNTELLRDYTLEDSRVRPLIMSIKKWASARSINDSTNSTLTSYAFVLMALYYLQYKCQPPVLRNLQATERWRDRHPKSRTARSFVTVKSESHPPPPLSVFNTNSLSLGDLFVNFLSFFASGADGSHSLHRDVVSIKEGQTF